MEWKKTVTLSLVGNLNILIMLFQSSLMALQPKHTSNFASEKKMNKHKAKLFYFNSRDNVGTEFWQDIQ